MSEVQFIAREYFKNKLNIPIEQIVELRDRVTPWRTKNQDGSITPPMEPTLTRFRFNYDSAFYNTPNVSNIPHPINFTRKLRLRIANLRTEAVSVDRAYLHASFSTMRYNYVCRVGTYEVGLQKKRFHFNTSDVYFEVWFTTDGYNDIITFNIDPDKDPWDAFQYDMNFIIELALE